MRRRRFAGILAQQFTVHALAVSRVRFEVENAHRGSGHGGNGLPFQCKPIHGGDPVLFFSA